MEYMLQDWKGFNCVRLLICLWYFKHGDLAYIMFYIYEYFVCCEILLSWNSLCQKGTKLLATESMKIHLARRFWIHHTWPGATKLLYMYYLEQHAYALLDLRFFVGWKENETQDRHSFLMTLLFFKKIVGKGDRIYFVMFDPPFPVSWIADDWREITRVIQMCWGMGIL
jgi:hypothetical protein